MLNPRVFEVHVDDLPAALQTEFLLSTKDLKMWAAEYADQLQQSLTDFINGPCNG